jgi:hypothetical protein
MHAGLPLRICLICAAGKKMAELYDHATSRRRAQSTILDGFGPAAHKRAK